jgi:hypothetical protein
MVKGILKNPNDIYDIPTKLGPSFIIRSFIPGFIASSLYYLTFYAVLKVQR